MTLDYFVDHLFDLLNESDLLDISDICSIENGHRVAVWDGTVFDVVVSKTVPKDNIVQLFPRRLRDDDDYEE